MSFPEKELIYVKLRDCSTQVEILRKMASGQAPPISTDPRLLFEIARVNKLLMHPGWPDLQGDAAEQVNAELNFGRMRGMVSNNRGLKLAAEITKALDAGQIPHLHLKGPLQQIRLYGTPLFKPSGDVDILVAPKDRIAAGKILEEAGFKPTEAELGSWWVHFLGERHFEAPDQPIFVDLHHSVQQPGLPRPRNLVGFLHRAVRQSVANSTLPVPSPPDMCLIAAITLCKAFLSHEPAGSVALDMIKAFESLELDERDQLEQLARQTGLSETLDFAMALATISIGKDGIPPRSHELLAGRSAETVRDMVFQPWKQGLSFPRRREILASLCGRDLWRLVRESNRAFLSNAFLYVIARTRKPVGEVGETKQ